MQKVQTSDLLGTEGADCVSEGHVGEQPKTEMGFTCVETKQIWGKKNRIQGGGTELGPKLD